MSWLLLLIYFAGPTSPQRIDYRGPFASKAECEAAYSSVDASRRWHQSRAEHVCIPVGKIEN